MIVRLYTNTEALAEQNPKSPNLFIYYGTWVSA